MESGPVAPMGRSYGRVLLALVAKELRVLSRDLHGLAVLFVMPAVFILIMSLALRDTLSPGRQATLQYLWLDEDAGYFALALGDALAARPVLARSVAPDEDALREQVAAGKAPFAVRIAPGLKERIAAAAEGGTAPLVQLYRRALDELGQPHLPVGIHGPGHVGETDDQARDELWPHYREMHTRIGRERGWPAMTRQQFDHQTGPEGALMVGSPETVAAKIVRAVDGLGANRFDMKYSAGTLPHEAMLASIERYATEVVPRVRAELAHRSAA